MQYKLSLLLSLFALQTQAQSNTETIFYQTAEALDKLKVLQYDVYREINNYKDNYFAKNSGTAYFEFNNSKEGKLERCQLRSDKVAQIYNGTELFNLYLSDKTYDGGKSKPSRLSNLSLFFNSIATLRISLPVIAADASIPKSVKDTSIDGKKYLFLKFALNKKAIEFPGGFTSFESEVIKYYELLVEPASKMPFMIIDRNSIMGDQYYTKTIFTNITTNPPAPVASSWFISGHEGYTLKKDEKRRPMIAAGNKLPDWSLPVMTTHSGDSLNSAALAGKKTVIEFWIKNCGYCMAAFPEVKELQEKFGRTVNIVSVNAYEEKEDVEFFYKREKPSYKMLYGGEKLANQLGIYGYPSVVVLDENGLVTFAKAGFNKEEILSAIKK